MTEMPQTIINSLISIPQMEDTNSQLMKFKNEILGLISQSETRINCKIEYYNSDRLLTKSDFDSSLSSINTKYDQMTQSIASMSVRVDRLASFEAFSRKTNDQIITQEIRLNNLSKDLTRACYKYDKIYMDNLILPGYIGDCCKFKTLKDFFDDVITQLVQLNSFKEKQSIEIKGCKERLESVIQNFNSQVSGLNKASMKFTCDSIKDSEETMRDMFNGVNTQITELNLDNSKHIVEIRKQCKELTDEWKKIADIKNEINAKSSSDTECVKKLIQNTKNSFESFKQEFNSIKSKFGELATFIKDVRFRKNVKGDVKKKDISAIVKKLNFKRHESLEILNGDKFIKDCGNKGSMPLTHKKQKQSLSHDVESKLKKYINGETDIDHLNQLSVERIQNEEETDQERDIGNESIETNNKIIHELGAELEQSNCKLMKESIDKETFMIQKYLMNESPILTQSYSCKHINTTVQMNNASLNGDSTNTNANANANMNVKKQTAKRHYSLGSIQPLVNNFDKLDKKKDNTELDSKLFNTVKMVYNLESFTKQKINELSAQIALLLNLNGFSLKVNGMIQSMGTNTKNGGNSYNKNQNQRFEMHKDQELSLSFSNKVVPVSVIDLVKRNNFPIPNIQNMSSTLGNTSLVVKPRVKARIKTGREPIDKILMQTFGVNNNNNINFNDDSNNNSTIRDSHITPYSKDLNNKTGSSSLNNLADFRSNKKEKKQLINCDSKITPGKYISLQKLITNTPQTSSNPDIINNN